MFLHLKKYVCDPFKQEVGIPAQVHLVQSLVTIVKKKKRLHLSAQIVLIVIIVLLKSHHCFSVEMDPLSEHVGSCAPREY